jgi:hypothetical protein
MDGGDYFRLEKENFEPGHKYIFNIDFIYALDLFI